MKVTIGDFKVGDILLITHKTKQGYDTRIGQVSVINYKGNSLVTYHSYNSSDFTPSGSSAFDPESTGKKPFGIISICIIGHEKTWDENFHGPRPGDRAYDLMC